MIMLIRSLIATLALTFLAPAFQQPLVANPVAVNVELAKREKYLFKIETKSGGIVGNILIEGKGLFDCISKLKKRYPGCTVLDAKKK